MHALSSNDLGKMSVHLVSRIDALIGTSVGVVGRRLDRELPRYLAGPRSLEREILSRFRPSDPVFSFRKIHQPGTMVSRSAE